jgi:predicted RNA-binding Zn-ribbon protein involved in translation (DUF1610 family)
MADRKYRQQGYRNPDSTPQPRRPERPAPDAPRRVEMLAQRTVSRCGACGELLPIATASLEHCPSCRAAIHACRQCTHFDTSQRFQCTQPIAERVEDKAARNDCGSFTLRVTIERNASPDSTRPADIRRAFDNLFRK